VRCSLVIAVIAVIGSGCNLALGLDDTIRDADGDQIADDLDNCPSVANPMQVDHNGDAIGDLCVCVETGADVDGDAIDDGCDECIGAGPLGVDSGGDGIDDGCETCAAATGLDRDGDQVDDGCDSCLLGPPHDEDGDSIADRCDVCPSIVDPAQAIDLDADFIGDVCDPGMTPEELVVFDPFTDDHSQLPADWTIGGDALNVLETGNRYTYVIGQVPDKFLVESRVVLPASAGSELGFLITTATCSVVAPRTLKLVAAATTQTLSIRGSGPIRLRMEQVVISPSGSWDVICAVIDDASNVVDSLVANDGAPLIGSLGIYASSGSFEYVWLLRGPF